MKLAFAGTPEFARVALAALHSAGHSIHLVLTQPDRPAGRGLKLQASPVKQFALQHGIPVAQPRSLRLDGKYPDDARMAQAVLQEGSLDAMVVAAYGLILPQWVLDLPLSGCFNIHASSLPRWRGAAPIHRAIEAGDSSTGVTIMQMDAGLDTGDMVLAQTLPILPTDTTGSLHDKLADLGAALMVQALSQLQAGKLQRLPQPAVGICYASKIDKLEAGIDWNQTAEVVARRVRAFNPNPVAHTSLNGESLKIWAAHAAEVTSAALPECGTILAVAHTGIEVAAIGSVLILTELQRPGGKRLPVADFLRGFDIKHGMRLV
ncbi:MAG: methionyl-tRNA formyltransferase [Rhodoferax sp.]|nr:methionyl-tRNA formyltransferase [Rhodoferax sp.]MBP9148382.1 methionyl-tRNA formyltransferase [Rhodoferax sp.]